MSVARPPDAPIEARAVVTGCVVDVAGIAIRLHASDTRRAEAVASLFRHALGSPDASTATLEFGADPVAVPDADPSATVAGANLWRPAPGALYIRNPEGLTARSSAGEIVIGGDAPALARVFRYTCFLALTHLLAQHGRHLLHAGAVAVGDGALLILGDTGSGKSTLVFAAHTQRWPVLSDDVIAVQRTGDGLVAQGLPRPVSVPRDVAARPIEGGRPVPEDFRERTELPMGTLARATYPVIGVVVTGGRDEVATVDERDSQDTLRAALRASPSLIDPEQRADVLAIAAALARLPSWSLHHGPDPATALDDGTRQLATIRRRLGGSGTAGS